MGMKLQGMAPPVRVFDDSGIYRDDHGVLHYISQPASIVEMLVNSVTNSPAAIAVQEVSGPGITYLELLDRVEITAGGLVESGVSPGDRVGMLLGNGIDWVVAFFAIAFSGAVIVPINTRLAQNEIDYIVADSGVKYVFRPGNAFPTGQPFRYVGAGRSDLAQVLYTSGTTGFPKGAMLSNDNVLSNIETGLRIVPLTRHALRNLVSVPLFHVTGSNAQMVPTIALGGTLVVMPVFDVKAFIAAIRDYEIDTLVSVPAIYWFALVQPEFETLDTSRVKCVLYGGAPMPPDLVHRLMKAFPNARVGNGFGLTETSSVATFLPHEYAEAHAESVGFPAPTTEVDLFEVDPQTGVGELLVRGSNVAMGYWNKPDATREAFVDGWLHTGDLARIDPDGLVTIVDRKKDMINRGGENVYCVEVENVLAEFPGVFEVAVIGVPDEMMGEKVGAIVVPVPGAPFSAQAMVEFARTRLADYKVPQYVWVKDGMLPRNAGGKVLKPELRTEAKWGLALF